jgi:hypothetical protein
MKTRFALAPAPSNHHFSSATLRTTICTRHGTMARFQPASREHQKPAGAIRSLPSLGFVSSRRLCGYWVYLCFTGRVFNEWSGILGLFSFLAIAITNAVHVWV